MKEDVIIWLKNGANAQEGVQLMQRACAPSLTLRLIRANPVANKRLMVSFLIQQYGIAEDYSVCWSQPEVVFQPKKARSFREEFSFLNEAGCPVELEALASRKFARYHAYIDLHKQLRDCGDLNACAKVARELIDSYLENRAIWAELNYYQRHRTILGKHPIFASYARRKQLLSMSVKDLISRQRRIEGNIWRVQSELKKGSKPHLDQERKNRLDEYRSELAEVNRLLDEE